MAAKEETSGNSDIGELIRNRKTAYASGIMWAGNALVPELIVNAAQVTCSGQISPNATVAAGSSLLLSKR